MRFGLPVFLLLLLLIFSLAMQRILPTDSSYSHIPYNILWIVRGHVCVCVCVWVRAYVWIVCDVSNFLHRNCYNRNLQVFFFFIAHTRFIVHVFSVCDFLALFFATYSSYSVFVVRSVGTNYLDAAADAAAA